MKKIGLIGLLNSKAKSGIIYSSPVTFKLSNSSIYILICAHSSGKPVISVFTTYDNKILHTQLSEPSFAKIEDQDKHCYLPTKIVQLLIKVFVRVSFCATAIPLIPMQHIVWYMV